MSTTPPYPSLHHLRNLCRTNPNLAVRLLPNPPPTLLLNTVLIGLVFTSRPHSALRLLASHPSTPLDPFSFSSALTAAANAGLLLHGKSLHAQLLKHPHDTRVLRNALLTMYASCGSPNVETAFLATPRRRRNVVSYNIMIDWFVKVGKANEALGCFVGMLESGIGVSKVSFVNLCPAVGGRRLAECVFGMVCKLGEGFVGDLFVVSSVIFMFCRVGSVGMARRVFDRMVGRNVEVWNTLIGGYVNNGMAVEAVRLFKEIVDFREVSADFVTVVAVMNAVSQLRDVGIGRQVHGYVLKSSGSFEVLPVIVSNAIMVMYSRCDVVTDAFQVFERMSERDVVSWNTMVSAFVQKGMDFEGLMLAYEMQKQGFAVDSVTVTALLSAASNLADIRIGTQTHAYVFRHGIQCDGLESYLIDMYGKSGAVETARRLFDAQPVSKRDQVTWNAMISGYAQSGLTEEAILVLRMMLVENEKPNSVTLASILPACNAIGGARLGKQIHGFVIRNNLGRNVFVETALVDMYSKCGSISYAETMFEVMAERNSVTYTTMISAFGQHGLGERALHLFKSMQLAGLKPDSITLVAILSACSYTGLVDVGVDIFNSLESKFGIIPTPEHYGCVVDMLGRSGRVGEAFEFLSDLGDKGNFVGIWGSLLAACRMYGEFELGKIVAEKLFELGEKGGKAGYHVLMSNVYASEKEWENVDKIRKEMRKKGLSKEPGSSWIEIGDSAHKFLSRDKKHLENNQIHEILEGLAAEMKQSGYDMSEVIEKEV